ncbi:Rieske 2Fe-2S domain-containing protein [Echinicola sp. CAU 1574]|uniref:Rieske 2Fe-2S domain-containing protein n=1 Tax=Echinicola arenosa TaxID=2774144 RepID=A0ABR9AQI5_9BACT|nr:Rieske 2Fe-2S domain-containing protein [Echinicola arenosa]MBD8491037.1 Rieske 2Fe-2S domain-containing protein [Echinicola arenosa]
MGKFTLGSTKEEVFEMLPEGNIKVTQLGAKKLCVVRKGEEVYAFEQLCPHRGAPLKDGHINGYGEVICALHSYRFDMKTGQLKSGGSCGDLEVYQTHLTDSGLEIMV